MISVVIPVYNEQDNIAPLLEELMAVAQEHHISEIIYVDDGSTDNTFSILKSLRVSHPYLRIIQHSVRAGQSASFLSGVRAAGNRLVVLMDGDGQNNPADIGLLYEAYRRHENNFNKVMVAGQRLSRKDVFLRRISSRIANKIRAAILHDNIRDTGCSLKLICRDDYLALPYFDHMHRFLPALLMRDNVEIATVGVSHRLRLKGASKYGFWNRAGDGIIDLIGVRWLLNRARLPNLEIKEII